MPPRPTWVVELLNPSKHNRSHFSCGNEALDRYLKKQASQDIKRKLAKVFVACQPRSNVLGYYTLSAASFNKDSLPLEKGKKLPYADVPAVLIGRLAVDQTWQGKKLGEFLLIDACRRVVETSQSTLAINAIIVHAKDKKAKDFYAKYGFVPFVDEPLHLFIPTQTIEDACKF